MKIDLYMKQAISLAEKGMKKGHGGPFGAIIVKDDTVIGEGHNSVILNNDPTAHAEILAIRAACKKLSSFSLEGATLFTSCEPCPMCLAAIYWARIHKVYFAATRSDATTIDFDDEWIYSELAQKPHNRHLPMENILRKEATAVFDEYRMKTDRIHY